jgi:hypothetical protein
VAVVRWVAITLLALEAAAAALFAFLLGSITAFYWPAELASRQGASAQRQLSWLDALTQGALLIAVFVIFATVPAAIALGAARRPSSWLLAGAAYQLCWALLLTPVIVGSAPGVSRVGLAGAVLFLIAALGQKRRRPRRT